MEKEKQNYDFDNVQSQLDKALGQATRMQKERETIQLEADRLRDKHEKAQVMKFSFDAPMYIKYMSAFQVNFHDAAKVFAELLD